MGKRKKPPYFQGDQWFNKKVEGRTREALAQRNGAFAREHKAGSKEALLDYVRSEAARLWFTPNAVEIIGGTYIASRFGGWYQAVTAAAGRRSLQTAKSTKRNSSARRGCSNRSVKRRGNSGGMRTGLHPTPLPKLRKRSICRSWNGAAHMKATPTKSCWTISAGVRMSLAARPLGGRSRASPIFRNGLEAGPQRSIWPDCGPPEALHRRLLAER